MISFSFAFIISEVIVRFLVRYPDYGVEYFVYGISSNIKWQAQYYPYSRYFNNESGRFNVFMRNNLGLPGLNAKLEKKIIFVFGSSFIEAAQVPPENISVSVFQQLIEKNYPNFTVLNLGRKAHDLYDCWFRYNYYKRIYEPAYVILIIDQRNSFNRHLHPLNFSLPQNFGNIDKRLKVIIGTKILSSSSYLSLCYRGFRDIINKKNNEVDLEDIELCEDNSDNQYSMLTDIQMCILQFKKDVKCPLLILSICNDKNMNNKIKAYCDSLKIYCNVCDNIQSVDNQINGSGHFNIKGNYMLGNLIYDTFIDSRKSINKGTQ